MDLIRDVLDNQIVDRNQRRMGKVDGILVELREGKPPLVKYIECGWLTKARRLHPRVARWLRRRVSRPYRIPWQRIRDIGVDVEIGQTAEETPLLRTENRLRGILGKVPGG
jgi:sporulation protein YlmC with PRC-barrel domain